MMKAGIRQLYKELTAEMLRRQALVEEPRNAVKSDIPTTSGASG